MSEYVKNSISKGEQANTTVSDVLMSSSVSNIELIHGGWIKRAWVRLKQRRMRTPCLPC